MQREAVHQNVEKLLRDSEDQLEALSRRQDMLNILSGDADAAIVIKREDDAFDTTNESFEQQTAAKETTTTTTTKTTTTSTTTADGATESEQVVTETMEEETEQVSPVDSLMRRLRDASIGEAVFEAISKTNAMESTVNAAMNTTGGGKAMPMQAKDVVTEDETSAVSETAVASDLVLGEESKIKGDVNSMRETLSRVQASITVYPRSPQHLFESRNSC